MRIPSRLRTLLAAFALTASVAGCGDAPSPTASAADDAAPRQGRMLSPGQASQVKPGDFIIYRPEDYARYGISTFKAPGGGVSAYYGWYGQCSYTPYGYSCCDPYNYYGYGYGECCYDPYGNPTYGYGCEQPCYEYDVNGGQIPCGSDPCYDQYGNALCPAAQFNYGSSAPFDGEVDNGGIILKQLRLISFSKSIANVSSLSVAASFKNVGAANGGCNNIPGEFDSASASATGSPAFIEVSRVAQWLGTIKWQVDGVHSFAPVTGASGGGTFYSTASYCG